MSTLCVQGDQRLMKDVSVCISAIAGLEIPEGLWGDFVQVMTTQALQNDNLYYKMAGIHNIGLVVEIWTLLILLQMIASLSGAR